MTNLTQAPKFTISMLCHNKLGLTQACVASVLKHSANYEFIITDNASVDGTQHWLKELAARHLHVRVVTNAQNKGFKDPHTHALTLARGEFFVLLNNDMEVSAGWLEVLAKPFAEDAKMALTGVAGTCCALDENLHAYGGPKAPAEYIEGSCLMIPTGLARRHGLFAPWLKFIYWEDTELAFRMREQGYRIKHVELPMKHDKPGSTSSTVPECREALRHNTEQMKQRWGWYFVRRDMKRRILVRRLGAHGDVLLATPALKALRERYPKAEIGVVTKCPQMLKGLNWLTTKTVKRAHYDQFIDLDLAYESRPEVHIVQAFADKLEVTLPKRWQMHMVASEADEVWAERTSRGAKLALVHAGPSCWSNKNWTLEPNGELDYTRWGQVIRALQRKGYLVGLVGDANGQPLACDLNLLDGTTPQQLYALCKRTSLFMGIDSMCQHVASAADTPSVVLFGPTNPRAIIRPTPRIAVVQADVRQVPCVGAHGRREKAVTASPCDGSCTRAITTEMVLGAVERVERLTT
jgi:ADP-heptose:LPS heptosyltransferase